MKTIIKRRYRKYLMRKYEEMTPKAQQDALNLIVNRLDKKDILNKDVLIEIVEELKKDNWQLSHILAHLDVMDIEDRI